jgi:cysteine-rich repeat protein
MTKKYRMLSRTLMLLPAMVLLAVTTPAMADSIVVCPPHGGEFPDEPVIQDTDTQTTTRVHNQQTRAVAKRACIRCGDGIPEPGEQCDTGGQTTTCDADCTTVACGDGIVNTAAGELCDDGNEQSGDGCSSTCMTEVIIQCGNGILEAGEQCDDANTVETDFCTNSCTNATCGDSILCSTCNNEECDTGGQSESCNFNCTIPSCGDGIVNSAAGEQCEPPAEGSCDATCRIAQQPVCDPGRANCDGSSTNGCEVDTNNNPNNCGGCGFVCNFQNAVGGCAMSQCTIAACNSGWCNTDGITGNGCEVLCPSP